VCVQRKPFSAITHSRSKRRGIEVTAAPFVSLYLSLSLYAQTFAFIFRLSILHPAPLNYVSVLDHSISLLLLLLLPVLLGVSPPTWHDSDSTLQSSLLLLLRSLLHLDITSSTSLCVERRVYLTSASILTHPLLHHPAITLLAEV